MHAKSDSEVTSLAPSSPTRSPRRPVYYVQSPSRDSHDGEKMSFQSTPILSPMGSPPHSSSSVGMGRHSRESSTSRFSGSLKSGLRKVQPHDGRHAKGNKGWKHFSAIEEEQQEPYDEFDHNQGWPKICYYFMALMLFVALFTILCLGLWGGARSSSPDISVKSITFNDFYTSAGTDATGVPTKMITMNATLKMSYHNTGAFFGVHVTSTAMNLMYYDLVVATGQVKKFYEKRKSRRAVSVMLYGNKIPLYGGGASFSTSQHNRGIPLDLTFTIRSKAFILGHLVKTKFLNNIDCNITVDSNKLGTSRSLKKACKYS